VPAEGEQPGRAAGLPDAREGKNPAIWAAVLRAKPLRKTANRAFTRAVDAECCIGAGRGQSPASLIG